MKLSNKLYQLFSPLLFALLMVNAKPVLGENLTSKDYVIKMGTINIGGGAKTIGNIKLIDTVGQTAPGQFETTGFRIGSGFSYAVGKEPFSFTVSENTIEFPNLTANTFSRSQSTLQVGGVGIHGYTVSVIEDHPLMVGESQTLIPDTACDPAQKCTPAKAAPWTAGTAHGFGYNMSGADTDQNDFVDATYFKPFPNNAANQNPIPIMAHHGAAGKKASATITYQTNISPTQLNGAYENSIQFIAIPAY